MVPCFSNYRSIIFEENIKNDFFRSDESFKKQNAKREAVSTSCTLFVVLNHTTFASFFLRTFGSRVYKLQVIIFKLLFH